MLRTAMQFPNLRKRLLHHRRFRQLIIGSVLVSIALGIVVVPIESQAEHPTIQSLSDGLWWSIQTLTTVGYGDVTPVTGVGRIIGVFMQIIGAVLFGALIAIIGSTMSRGQEEFYWVRLFDRLDSIEKRLGELEKYSGFLIKEKTDTSSQQEEI